MLPETPVVEPTLDRVDRTVVEAKRLGLTVGLARVQPGLARGREPGFARRGDEAADRLAQLDGRRVGVGVVACDQGRVLLGDRGDLFGRQRRVGVGSGRAGVQDDRQDGERESMHGHHPY